MIARAGDGIRRRGAAAIIAAAVALASPDAAAGPAESLPSVEKDPVQPPPPEVEEDMSSSERLDRARSLYERGRGKFETFDYIGAIELWTQAYSELPETDEFAGIRAKLMFNIAAARLSAFEIDDNIAHLRQARRLMDLYVDSLGEASDEEAADAREWQEKITERLKEAEAERKRNQKAEKPAPPVVTGPDPKAVRRARALTISGAVTLSIGIAALGAMGGGLVWGASLESRAKGRVDNEPDVEADDLGSVVSRGKTANALAIGMGVAGGVLLGTGIGLLVTGRLAAKKNGSSQRAVAPVFGRGLVGLSARWRF